MSAIHKPIKIYLDQKDYSRIGKGLLGNSQYDDDIKIYHFLIDLVNSNKIIIFYSYLHAVETLRYDDQKINLLKPYCEVIDSLTQGHCIKWKKNIVKLELELFLSQKFGFNTTIKDNYPYGKFMDAFPFPDNIFSGFGMEVKEKIKANFQNAPISREQRRRLLKLLDKPKEFKKLLGEFPTDQLNNISKELPGFNLTKEDFIEICCGNPSIEKEVLERSFNKAVKFENLVLHYSKFYPELKNVGKSLDGYTDKMYGAIRSQQEIHEEFPHLKMNENVVFKDWFRGYIESLDNVISEICNRYELKVEKAKEYLVKSELKGIPSINAYVTFCIEYYKRHKGNSSRGRKPKQSDLGDLMHIISLPYVDIFLTDRFFAEVARKKSKIFGTQVVTSLSQLKKVLEIDFMSKSKE